MRRVFGENGQVRISDDPNDVLGTTLLYAVQECAEDIFHETGGEGFVTEVCAVYRVEEETEVPPEFEGAYWAGEELWLAWYDAARDRVTPAVCLTGDELRTLFEHVGRVRRALFRPFASRGRDRLAAMRTLVARSYDVDEPLGRLPITHAYAVEDLVGYAASRDDTSTEEKLILRLAALAHDLFEDGVTERSALREQFGEQVDGYVEAMTRRPGDPFRAEHLDTLGPLVDHVRLIRAADLVVNVGAITRRLDALSTRWVRKTWMPLAQTALTAVLLEPVRLHTSAFETLRDGVALAYQSLLTELQRIDATAAPAETTTRPVRAIDPEVAARQLALTKEKEWREGQLLRSRYLFGATARP